MFKVPLNIYKDDPTTVGRNISKKSNIEKIDTGLFLNSLGETSITRETSVEALDIEQLQICEPLTHYLGAVQFYFRMNFA